jgi:glycosyltransferase involved in cell wall biosynthesis
MKIGIVIPTYRRTDGSTFDLLKRTLNSIKEQTYTNYKVFLIGDCYENHSEFIELATSIIDKDRIYYENLPVAVERERYPLGGIHLWCSGGVNATNYGIEKCLSDGIDYICHLDHDDYWNSNHIESIVNKILKLDDSYVFLATKSNYLNGEVLPKKSNGDCDYYPLNGDVIHSSTCVKFSDIPIRYRDVFSYEGRCHAADGDLWERLSEHMITNNKRGYLLNSVTCTHITEKT